MFASGGLIGGPSSTGVFQNVIEGGASYTETEGGCDYNAPFVCAIANIVAQLDPDHSEAEKIESTTKFNVYPAVIDDYVVVDPVEVDYSGNAVVSLLSAAGMELLSARVNGFKPVVLNTSVLPGGLYVVKVTFDGGVKTYKVLKSK